MRRAVGHRGALTQLLLDSLLPDPPDHMCYRLDKERSGSSVPGVEIIMLNSLIIKRSIRNQINPRMGPCTVKGVSVPRNRSKWTLQNCLNLSNHQALL